MRHEIKIREQYANAVLSGYKNFEVRYNDRKYQKGDLLKFNVIDERGERVYAHQLNDSSYEITYVLDSFEGLAQGYVAFGIKRAFGSQEVDADTRG